MTGILPIKKYGTQSALTDFCEYTMLEPGPLAEYAGFTEGEVRNGSRKMRNECADLSDFNIVFGTYPVSFIKQLEKGVYTA